MLMIAAAVNTVLVVVETIERFLFVMNAKKKKTSTIPMEKK